MAGTKKTKKVYIFGWPFESSKEVAGHKAKYLVQMATDGTLSCDCPGWVFYRDKTKPRTCKHCNHKNVQDTYKEYYKLYKAGKPLPRYEEPTVGTVIKATPPPTEVPFARCITFD